MLVLKGRDYLYQEFKLRNLSVEQQTFLAQNAGCNRFLWNQLVVTYEAEYKAYQEYLKKSEEFKDDPKKLAELTEVKCPSLRDIDVINRIPAFKKQYPFLKDVMSQPLQQRAKQWARAKREAVAGQKGHPKKQKKYKNDYFCIPQGFMFDEANGRVRLPKMGWVRYHKSANLKGKPKQIIIKREADGWHMFVCCEIERYIDLPLDPSMVKQTEKANIAPDLILRINSDVAAVLTQKVKAALSQGQDAQAETSEVEVDDQDATPSLDSIDIAALLDEARDEVLRKYACCDELKPKLEAMLIGLDVGVAIFAVLSCGASFDEIKTATAEYKERQSRLDGLIAKLQRQRSRMTLHSNNYTKHSKKLAKLHQKKRRIRDDFQHKLSSALVKNHDQEVFVCEELNIKGMTKSAKGTADNPGKNVKQKSGLNRSILNMAWGKFFRMLEYKLALTGRKLVKIDPRNTSRTCSQCGFVSKQNRLTQSQFKCVKCGFEANADLNAAVNIKNRFLSLLTQAGGTSKKGRACPDGLEPV